MQVKNHHNKNPNIFAIYIYLVLNVVFIPRYIVEGVQDDIKTQTPQTPALTDSI